MATDLLERWNPCRGYRASRRRAIPCTRFGALSSNRIPLVKGCAWNGRLTHNPAACGKRSGTVRIRIRKPVRESTCANPL